MNSENPRSGAIALTNLSSELPLGVPGQSYMSNNLNLSICLTLTLISAVDARAQARPAVHPLLTQSLVTHSLDESKTITLRGNTRPEANKATDRGTVAGNFRFEHMYLQLRRSPERQQALEEFLNEVQDPSSSNFHKWLSAQQFGKQFGLASDDLDTVTGWLESHGLTVNEVSPNLAIDFSGTAAQLREAFHTQMHHLSVAGVHHYANMRDPEIPAALAPVVAGVVSMNDFKPHPLTHVVPDFTTASGRYAVVPSDLSTIYNFNPAFAAGISGQGQTIAVLEDSNMYSAGDWLVFRKVFGLARPYRQGQLIAQHPLSSSGEACSDPGINENSVEAAVDAEWATAAAPNATIVVASCSDAILTSGVFIALQNLLTNGNPPPDIVSISFGMSEAFLGAAQNAYISSLYQMAVAEGVSVFVASGDSGAAAYDAGNSTAYHGIAVNGFSSTPYNVAVGATDFADTYLGTTTNYWSSTNSPTYGSALSYIPEITWNASCGSELLAFSKGFSTSYGASGFCNNGGAVSVVAGGGGPSGCATGSPEPGGVIGNTCTGYSKPAWQSVFGNPSDGVRDVPDVSLFASNAVWGHYYVACFSNPNAGGKSCLGDPSTWTGFGGTSLSAPTMAGIQALVNQKTGSRWGNPNPIYYSLAAAEYGSAGNASCDSSTSLPNSSCAFHDVTLGDTVLPCIGANNCFFGATPGANGVLSLSNTSYQPAYGASPGWDFATGLGSVNVWNLVTNWPNAGASSPGSN